MGYVRAASSRVVGVDPISLGFVIYLLPNGRQSRGLHALAYRILEVLLQTGAGLGLMVVRQS